MRIIWDRIKNLREENDFSQKDIARKLHIKSDTYSKWERGINDIPLIKINELANIYNVSLDFLLGLSNINTITEKNEIDFNLLAERLLKSRKDNKLTQDVLTNNFGFFQRTYSHYEDGSSKPTTFKLFHIASFYKISFDYLVGRTDNLKIN